MRRLGLRVALYAAMGLVMALALVGLAGWLLIALWLLLLTVTSPAAAALYTGLATLFAGLLIALILWAFARRRRAAAPAAQAGGFEGELATRLAAFAGRDAGSFISAHPGQAAMVALVVGLAVGASPRLRSALRDLVK